MTNGGLATIRSKRSWGTGSKRSPKATRTWARSLSCIVSVASAIAPRLTSDATTWSLWAAACTACTPQPVPRSKAAPIGRRIVAPASAVVDALTPSTWSADRSPVVPGGRGRRGGRQCRRVAARRRSRAPRRRRPRRGAAPPSPRPPAATGPARRAGRAPGCRRGTAARGHRGDRARAWRRRGGRTRPPTGARTRADRAVRRCCRACSRRRRTPCAVARPSSRPDRTWTGRGGQPARALERVTPAYHEALALGIRSNVS